ncbi:MAG: type II toxin-antitoxin system RelE/ParE family toxin [Candidatus Woesearchaeota archaeon]
MVTIVFDQAIKKRIEKIKNEALKVELKKQILKVAANPEVGKPTRYARKGTRELHIHPFRLSYSYSKKEQKVVLLDLYHKDEQ